jgi:hypothetical protein
VSVFAIVVLVAAIVLVVATHWPKLSARAPRPRRERQRARRKAALRVIESEHDDEFVRAVERDLAALPTTDEQDAKNR